MTSAVHVLVHSLAGKDDQLNTGILEEAEKINKNESLNYLSSDTFKVPVKQVVIGPHYLGILLEDGRAYRVAFSVIPERLDLTKPEQSKNNGISNNASANPCSVKNLAATGRQLTKSRSRIMRTSPSVRGNNLTPPSNSRSAGVIIGGNRSVVAVPAPFVPEELIAQAQVVLQGKSRNIIIRELQRTNLDVNLAVNNLLSRDDEEGDDADEASDNYVPEDLISLLDNGFNADNSVIIDAEAMFTEEVFGYSTIRNRVRSERNQSSSGSVTAEGNQIRSQSTISNPNLSGLSSVYQGSIAAGISSQSGGSAGSGGQSSQNTGERDSFIKWRDRHILGSRRWFATSREESHVEKEDAKKKGSSQDMPLWVSDELEEWTDKSPLQFTQIAAMFSEFIAVCEKGEIHLWKWQSNEPYKCSEANLNHPKASVLNLCKEKVVQISATLIRCTVLTESGKVATWMDEALGQAGNKFEQPLFQMQECNTDRIVTIHTCTLYTLARTEGGNLFWWGVLPFAQRKKLWEKFKTKIKKCRRSDVNSSELKVGSQVCMRNSPIYNPGAIGFTITNGVPKVGQLLHCVWDLNDVCKFKTSGLISSTGQGGACSKSLTTELKDVTKSMHFNLTSSGTSVKSSNSSKETADRLDMPPPPSPASSTCSDTGSVSSHKKNKGLNSKDEEIKRDEELWMIKDVIFVEDNRSVPVGRVVRIDGEFVAIKFQSNNSSDVKEESGDAWKDCRLMKIDDLQVVKSITSRFPDCIQKTPKKIVLASQQMTNENLNGSILAIAIDPKGIHAILKNGNKLLYSVFNLPSGREESVRAFPIEANEFMGADPKNISLNFIGHSVESSFILCDGNKTIFPMARDCLDAFRDPFLLNLPPVKCLAAAPLYLPSLESSVKTDAAVIILVLQRQVLLSKILRCDFKGLKNTVQQLEAEPGLHDLAKIVNEKCDGNRNIIHACVSMCIPASNKESDQELIFAGNAQQDAAKSPMISNKEIIRIGQGSISCEENFNNVQEPAQILWPNEYDHNSEDGDTNQGNASIKKNEMDSNDVSVTNPIERRDNSIQALSFLCGSDLLKPFLKELLSSKDIQGQTPFMFAVSSRAYMAGHILLDVILELTENDTQARDSMIFPMGSHPDLSPLYVLCCNDTCSFTWTGADHINQDIYECRTCGLTGSLCCCTECAKVCHKGHDCKLKRTSPTAYCDCWEKCKCKALVAGNQTKRFELLCKLIISTELVTILNSHGESIILFLVQTVSRQLIEQRQFRSTSRIRNSGNSRKTPSLDIDSEMPEHDLEPPKFARRALDRLLADWPSVRAMIMTGERKLSKRNNAQNMQGNKKNPNVDNLLDQNSTALLDKFTYCLSVRCNSESIDILLMTLVRELDNVDPIAQEEAQQIARRFIRSFARVFVIYSVEKLPSSEKYRNSPLSKYLQICRRVFQSLIKISIEELSEIADALIAPVRLGIARPTPPFTLALNSMDTPTNSDELFLIEPLASQHFEGDSEFFANTAQNKAPTVLVTSGDAHEIVEHRQRNEDSIVQDDEEISEQEEISDSDNRFNCRSMTRNSENEENPNSLRNEDAIQEAESDAEFNFNEAETESDSDDNNSTQETQPCMRGGTYAVPEEDSGDSSPLDDDRSDDGESDDDFYDESHSNDEQLERRPLGSGYVRSSMTPQSMQWAIRSRDANRQSSVRLASNSSGLVFIDPSTLRRSATVNASITAPSSDVLQATSASCLARAFGIVIRQISELFNLCPEITSQNSPLSNIHLISFQECVKLQMFVEMRLKPIWNWIVSVLDSTEAQLQFGVSLIKSTDRSHPMHPLHTSQSNTNLGGTSVGVGVVGSEPPSARREFLSYCLSLMRAHSAEHRDLLPVLDVTALKHVAYVLDGFFYYLRSSTEISHERTENVNWNDQVEFLTEVRLNINVHLKDEPEDIEEETSTPISMETDSLDESYLENTLIGARHSFFQRSESTLTLGCTPPDPFYYPLTEALPLADLPHLLKPNARREDLFGTPKLASGESSVNEKSTHLAVSSPLTGLSKTTAPTTEIIPPPTEPVIVENIRVPASSSSSQPVEPKKSQTFKNVSEGGEGSSSGRQSKSLGSISSNKRVYSDRSAFESKKGTHDEEQPQDLSCSKDYVQKFQEDYECPPSKLARLSHLENKSEAGSSEARPTIDQPFSMGHSSQQPPMEEAQCSESGSEMGPTIQRNFPQRGTYLHTTTMPQNSISDFLLRRWQLTLDLFGRVFMEDVGVEPGSVISELVGFPIKETRFRRLMEKLRNGQQRDLTLAKMERNRSNMLIQTFKELNTQYGNQNRRLHPPLAFSRVKVTFKDEPGEGSGVARSFYTSIAEALLVNEKLPNLESAQVGSSKYPAPFGILRPRSSNSRDMSSRRGLSKSTYWRPNRIARKMNFDARPFRPASMEGSSDGNEHLSSNIQQLGERLFPKVQSICSLNAPKITGILLELPPSQLLMLLASDENLRDKVIEANNVITNVHRSDSGNPAENHSTFKCNSVGPMFTSGIQNFSSKKMNPIVPIDECQIDDDAPLFFSPGKRGFYSPRQGQGSFERMNAFRNIGRLIGLCLLQNELLPLYLQRHVLKFLIGRTIRFHDLAFYDHILYESLRQLVKDSQSIDGVVLLKKLELNFVIDLSPEEGGGSVELVAGGKETFVNESNIFDYVRKYAECKMIKLQKKALEALRHGVFDVLPDYALDTLTAEDLRLLLNGVGDIKVGTLISYTTFNDESAESSDKLVKFKRWLWNIVEKMSPSERQDLVYFWTGSPALPASEDGFQPMPSVNIRPADDCHLPTANTCISRLYIPLYSNRALLKQKLLLAIKTKNFGFV